MHDARVGDGVDEAEEVKLVEYSSFTAHLGDGVDG